jgi:hypothetical protein
MAVEPDQERLTLQLQTLDHPQEVPMRSTLSFTAALLMTLAAQAQDHASHHLGAAPSVAPAASAARAKPASPAAASSASSAMGMEMRSSMSSGRKSGKHDDMHKPGGMHDQMHGSGNPMTSGGTISAMPAASSASK